MPKLNLTEDQISDVVAWLHVQTYAADHRNTYLFLDALTGDAKKGEAYFNGAGKCATCHSPTGDLKGIGAKFDAHEMQGHWLQPRSFGRGGRGGPSKSAITVTVTLADGKVLHRERWIAWTISPFRCMTPTAIITPSTATAIRRRLRCMIP